MMDGSELWKQALLSTAFIAFHSKQLTRMSVQISDNVSYSAPPSFRTLKRIYKSRLDREGKYYHKGFHSFQLLSIIGVSLYSSLYIRSKHTMKKRNWFRGKEQFHILASAFVLSPPLIGMFAPLCTFLLHKRDVYKASRIVVAQLILKDIVKVQGFRALYKGYHSLALVSVNAAFVYSLNDTLILYNKEQEKINNRYMGAVTGFIYSLILQPFCCLKRVHVRLKDRKNFVDKGYFNIIDSLRHLYKKDGISGFYRDYMRTQVSIISSMTLLFGGLYYIEDLHKQKSWRLK